MFLKFLVPKKKGNKKGGRKGPKGFKKVVNRLKAVIRDDDVKAIAKIMGEGYRQGSGQLSSRVGGLAGYSVGRVLGINSKKTRALGRNAGIMFSKITGYGDYTVSDNTLLKPSPVPDFGTQSIRVTHKEFLGNIYGSPDFQFNTFPLNPGVSKTFPWLAGIARNYQQYHINGLIFQYVSTSAFALGSTNSALGKVMLATNYNAEDPPFDSTVQMMATQYSNYCRPADSIMHAIECSPSETPNKVYYIRTDISEDAKDLRLSDIGFTEVATEGMQSTSEVGGLWISYDITLLKPILNPQISQQAGFDQFDYDSPGGAPALLFDGEIAIRNNRLAGDLTVWPAVSGENGYFRYEFADTIQSGYYLIIIELAGLPNTKWSQGAQNGFGPFNNCHQVLETPEEKGSITGPWQSKSQIYPFTPALSNTIDLSVGFGSGLPSTMITIVEVTKNPASFQWGYLFPSGTDGLVMRFHVFPINYDETPDPSKNS
jgi:hypothetical protein